MEIRSARSANESSGWETLWWLGLEKRGVYKANTKEYFWQGGKYNESVAVNGGCVVRVSSR